MQSESRYIMTVLANTYYNISRKTKKSKATSCHILTPTVGKVRCTLPFLSLEPTGEVLKLVWPGQCDIRSAVTFPAAQLHHLVTNTKLHCLHNGANNHVHSHTDCDVKLQPRDYKSDVKLVLRPSQYVKTEKAIVTAANVKVRWGRWNGSNDWRLGTSSKWVLQKPSQFALSVRIHTHYAIEINSNLHSSRVTKPRTSFACIKARMPPLQGGR